MGSNYSALGFAVGDLDELTGLVRHVMSITDPIERADGGSTFICGTSWRASLAIHTDQTGTVTCVGIGPAPTSKVDAVTGNLKLL